MSLYSQSFRPAVMLGGDSIDQAAEVDRLKLLAAVMRAITCPYTGEVLDVSRAVYATLEKDGRTIKAHVVAASRYDAVGGRAAMEALADKHGATAGIIDGRDYTKAGALKAAVKAARVAATAGQ